MINNFKDYSRITESMIDNKIDYTIIKNSCKEEDIIKMCDIAKQNNYHSVCILPKFIEDAKEELEDTNINICSFLDLRTADDKQIYTKVDSVLSKEVDEVDILLNIKKIKKLDKLSIDDYEKSEKSDKYNKEYDKFLSILNKLSLSCRKEGVIMKLILEIGELTISQMKIYADLVIDSDIEYVQTSSGLYKSRQTLKKVKILRRILPETVDIKVAGGIHNQNIALQYSNIADRIGTSKVL